VKKLYSRFAFKVLYYFYCRLSFYLDYFKANISVVYRQANEYLNFEKKHKSIWRILDYDLIQ